MSSWCAGLNLLALDQDSIVTNYFKCLINVLLIILLYIISGDILLTALKNSALYLSIVQIAKSTSKIDGNREFTKYYAVGYYASRETRSQRVFGDTPIAEV